MDSVTRQMVSEVIGFISESQAADFGAADFDALAMRVFSYQYDAISSYRAYCDHFRVSPKSILSPEQIPLVSSIAF
ncbi:MAG: hypothetical protein ACYDC3_14595, partial [Candidatus Binataceae bacterium]